ncbi:LacI family DNA-binding transcriptional regulator [Aeromicrobium sp. CTD01-1L150]|uniref:LacI family DNA-binding transcriptional regulator n=1 Tax=Aeromicrobium sp. CTD01-1L150 TaxID=3341830 RepID=UPI0035C090F6
MKAPTLHDVAAEAGVSIKTVSRVVNGATTVDPELRTRVEEVVERLQYVPNTLARSLKAGTGDTIGVVIDTIADPFFASLTSAVEDVALEAGLGTVFGSTGFDSARERSQVSRMAMQRVRALILAPTAGGHEYLQQVRPALPVVLVDRAVADGSYDVVRVDDEGLAHQAVAHLTARGHRRIAFVGSDKRFITTRHRLDGYHRALAEVDTSADPELVRPGPTRDVDATEETLDLLALKEPPTAIFAANPRAAIGVAHALHTTSRPDVAFISFGDFPLARTLEPAVTFVDQDPSAIGAAAMERVLAHLDGTAGQTQDIIVPTRLVERGSGEIEVRR